MTDPLDFNDNSKVPSEFTTDATEKVKPEQSYTDDFAEIARLEKKIEAVEKRLDNLERTHRRY
jgi:ubiquinone biosynthesis protein UbiJ